jgi:hypothetical protein
MSRTPQQLDAVGQQFATSLAGMSRSAAAKLVAKQYGGVATADLLWPVGATNGDREAVSKAQAWTRGLAAALEALDTLE